MNTPRRPRPCEICAKQYVPTYHQQRTCGRLCGAKVNAHTLRGKPKPTSCAVAWRECIVCQSWICRPRRRLCGRACELAHGRRRFSEQFVSQAQSTTLPCKDCGEDYTTRTASNCGVCKRCQRRRLKARFGSSDRKRARYYGVQYEPIDRLKVYERDGWRCGLCHKPVRRAVSAPHPLSPSLDHIVPISAGGDHLYANVQCAHFLCNSAKGDRGTPQQLALVG